MFNLFGKKNASQYDIHQVSENCYVVHLNDEQSKVLEAKGLTDVRELTLTRCESTWKVEYSYQLPDGSWKGVSSGGIAFADEPLEAVLKQFFE